MTTHATLQAGTHDELEAQVAGLARGLDPQEYLAGTWLRELAVLLALHTDLAVSVVIYDHGAWELEVRLAGSTKDGLVITHDASGDHCQISLDLWVAVKDEPSAMEAVGLARRLLEVSEWTGK